MGRKKLKIQRLEDLKARQAKYSKRKIGILKKAKELNILCEVDVALLFSSPSGRPTLFVGKNSKGLSSILKRLSNLSFEEREERRAYTIEMLKKIYENSESEFDPLSLSYDTNADTLKLYKDELQELKHILVEKSKILRDWRNPNNVEDINQIKMMEDHLIASLDGLRSRKVHYFFSIRIIC
ncbi:agamous-like MADS-box protein AGL65 [Gossypium hirsutum]|uniref:Agamous-like MADS-box protein AGL65 n=1 Tax=Gossypium hirsutum TaxID=3635 RepID=A0ABM2ZZH5_GOSHI|nr:agamous-like MADS-box protein AGL65 [Gossypium hirsutum]